MSSLVERMGTVDWTSVSLVAAFLITFATFAFFTWRAVRMPQSKADRQASLPLEDDPE